MKSLDIRFEPIVFYSERNEYELHIEFSGCSKDLVKVTHEKESGKLNVQGYKEETEFVQQFFVPDDCLTTEIYGQFQGEVLYIIMPRLLSERPPSEDASSKQEDDQKDSSDRKATEQAGEDRDKLPARAPAPPPSDQKSTDEVKERGGKYRDKLPARVPAPSSSDREATEKLRRRDSDGFPKISAPPPSALGPSRSEKKLEENYEGNRSDISKQMISLPFLVVRPSREAARAPGNWKTTEIRARKEEEENQGPPSKVGPASPSDQKKAEQGDVKSDKSVVTSQKNEKKSEQEDAKNAKIITESKEKEESAEKTTEISARKEEEENPEPPSTVGPASPSNQKKYEQGDVESDKSVVTSQKNKKKSEQEDAKNAKIVTESKAKEETAEKKPSAGGSEMLGLVAKVKETGKAAVAAAMKEENRLVMMVGAAVLTILVIGASLRSSR